MQASLVKLILMVGFLTLGFSPMTSFAADTEAKPDIIDMSEPPFWMSSYEEFSDLQADQKEFYLDKFFPLSVKLPGLEKLSKEKLKDATEWFQSWNSLRRKVYEACREPGLNAACEEIADVRISALSMHANQKQENRRADREVAKEKKKKKSEAP